MSPSKRQRKRRWNRRRHHQQKTRPLTVGRSLKNLSLSAQGATKALANFVKAIEVTMKDFEQAMKRVEEILKQAQGPYRVGTNYGVQGQQRRGWSQHGTGSGWPYPPEELRMGEEPSEEEELVAGSVVGYRVWKANWKLMLLRSTGVPHNWGPNRDGVWKAQCLEGGRLNVGKWRPKAHTPPGPYCACGFWGVWGDLRLDMIIDVVFPYPVVPGLSPYPYANWEDLGICGKIEGWGRVQEHEWGFRAEKVRIKELYFFPPYTWSDVGERGLDLTPASMRDYVRTSLQQLDRLGMEGLYLGERRQEMEAHRKVFQVATKYGVPLVEKKWWELGGGSSGH